MAWDRSDYQPERRETNDGNLGLARALFVNTWPQALAMLLLLIGIAATLQRLAHGTTTFADAASAVWAQR